MNNQILHKDDEEETEERTIRLLYLFPSININTTDTIYNNDGTPYIQNNHNPILKHERNLFMQNNHNKNTFIHNNHPGSPFIPNHSGNPFMQNQNHIPDDIEQVRYKKVSSKADHNANQRKQPNNKHDGNLSPTSDKTSPKSSKKDKNTGFQRNRKWTSKWMENLKINSVVNQVEISC